MTTPFRLRVESGPNAGQTFAIDGPGATVGRQEGNTIVLDDPRLSRRHLRLDLRDGTLVATDLGSANGTLLNGVDLGDSRPLHPGDRLQLGDTTLRVEGVPPPTAPPAPPAGAGNAATEGARAPFSLPLPAPPATAAPHLTVEDGAGAGRQYPLGHAPLTIGRQEGNDIVLDDAQVSRRHARVELRGERAVIADLGSVNEVLVNGRRIDGSQPLWPGDRIEIGATTLRFAGDAAGAPAQAGAGAGQARDLPLASVASRSPAWATPAAGGPSPVVPAVPPPPLALPPPAAAPRRRGGRLPLLLAGGLGALLLVCALGAGGIFLLLRPGEPAAEPAGVAAPGSAAPGPTPIATPPSTAPSATGPGGTPAGAPVSLPGSAGGNAAPPPPGAEGPAGATARPPQPTATATRPPSSAVGDPAATGPGAALEHASPAGWARNEAGSGRMPRVAR